MCFMKYLLFTHSENKWFLSSSSWPCELADLESRIRVLMRLAEKTSHRDTLEVLCNLPGLKEPNSERRKDLFVACNVKKSQFFSWNQTCLYIPACWGSVTRIIRQCQDPEKLTLLGWDPDLTDPLTQWWITEVKPMSWECCPNISQHLNHSDFRRINHPLVLSLNLILLFFDQCTKRDN